MPNLSDLLRRVTLNAVQTLTNKTLTAPTINGGTADGQTVTNATIGSTNAVDTGALTGDAATGQAALGVVIGTDVQAYSANLDGWAAIATSSKQDYSANLAAWSSLATSAKQDYSANLAAWSAIAPASKQTASANLTTYAGKTPPSGAVVGTTDTQTLTNKTISGGDFAGDSNFDSGTLFVDASTNRVGVGTTSPASDFEVEAGAPTLRVNGTTNTVIATITASDAVYLGSTKVLVLSSNSVERARFDTSGRLLIGTTGSGSSKLRIVGLPTSSAGLSSGDVWNDSGTLKIA